MSSSIFSDKSTQPDDRKLAEGRGLRLEIRTRGDVEHVKKLVAIKVMN